MKLGGVKNVSSALFVTGFGASMDIMRVEDSLEKSQQLLSLNYVTNHFVELMEMELIQGRDFDINNPADADQYVLINETAARKLGWEEYPLGKMISPSDRPDRPFKVLGVIKDFHYAPPHQEIGPMVYFLKKEGQPEIFIRLDEVGQPQALEKIEKTWKVMFPSLPFTYNYLDQVMDEIYIDEEKLLRLMGLFTLFSIFIALLGLFSLSSYITEQYTRVIGIKKVFGASSFMIVSQLSGQHLILIFIACMISIPVCWYIMDLWLSQYAYHTPIKASWFILSTLLMIFMAEATVVYQSIKAANRNPVDSLRYE
jgi:putative ABC transport system permease protein